MSEFVNSEHFNNEKNMIWDKIQNIDTNASNRISELENENAKLRAELDNTNLKIQQIENILTPQYIMTISQQLNETIQDVKNKQQGISNTSAEIYSLKENIIEMFESAKQNTNQINLTIPKMNSINEFYNILFNQHVQNDKTVHSLSTQINILHENMQNNFKSIEDTKKKSDDIISDIKNNQGKIQKYYSNSKETLDIVQDWKSKISDVVIDIFGETSTNGKKGKIFDLENTYNQIKNDIKNYKENIITNFEDFKQEHSKVYEQSKMEIQELLPGALTKGLSFAYNEKLGEERKELKSHRLKFMIILIIMAIISLFPLGILLHEGKSFDEIIKELPNFALNFLPLYIPALWFAIYTNKNINLSKRLIEEYAYKGSLTKTYQGLSKQINDLQSSSDNNQLKLKERLLENIVNMTGENPGKLISGYENSDHPILSLFHKSKKIK